MFGGINPTAGLLLSLLVLLQAAGLASAWLARLTLRARPAAAATCQAVFYTLLSLVALSTMISLTASPAMWLLSGGTLALMILTVLCDFSAAAQPVAATRRR
jgi:hypothetical protein